VNNHLILTLSNFIHVLIEIIHGRIIAELCILGPDKNAKLGTSWHLEVLLSFHTSVWVTSRLIKLNSDPKARGKFGYGTNIFDLTSARTNHQFTSLPNSNLVSILLLEVIRNLIAWFLHKVRVLLLHVRLKLSEGIVALIVLLLTDLILFNLRDILKLRQQTWYGINNLYWKFHWMDNLHE
jgi:hypothetical protein